MAQAPLQSDRLAAQPNFSARTMLKGEVPAWAVEANDQGSVLPDTPLRVTFVLSRTPERQAAFTKLLADQQTLGTPQYHQWLTPQQVGEIYGPAQHDLDALTSWLSSQALDVLELAPSHVFLTVTGSAAALGTTLGTSFHYFSQHGELRRSATVDPTLPTSLSALVSSVSGLVDVTTQPMHEFQTLPLSARTIPGARAKADPQFNSASGTHYITPTDFATIFDMKSPQGQNTGTGQKVAIIGRSRVATTDISEYETSVGITPQNLPNVIIPSMGIDPGTTGTGDQAEATLDVDRVIGTAPQVQADLVISSSADGYDGIFVAAQYEVQTLLDPVMTISFGACEAYAGPQGVSLWDTLFSQAASEGISVFVSSSDSGAAACDPQFGTPPEYQIRSINYLCASSYATCVGGTELVEDGNFSQYWSTTNGPTLGSALGYIPEGAWNEPFNSNPAPGVSPYVAAATGGGASIYVPKPVWQAGIGVPADSARDVPDVSFPAAAHDAYFSCYASGGGDCANNRFAYFYGTSAAAPAMAGIAALLNQRIGSAQGNFNPLLYRIAASTPAAFHDATPASSGLGSNCDINTASVCNNSVPSYTAAVGGLVGFALTTGYDQATGLGSLDVANFLTAAAAGTQVTLAPTSLKISENATTITDLQTAIFTAVLTSKTAGTPSGNVQFFADGNTLGAPVALAGGVAVTPALPFAAAGSYYISATYTGDSTYAASTAPGTSLVVSGQTALVTVSVASSLITVGTQTTFSVTLAPSSGSVVPTGVVRFYASTSTGGSYVATVPLVHGSAMASTLVFSSAGSYTVTAFYLGDSVFSPARTSTSLTVQKMPTFTLLSSTAGDIGLGGYKGFTLSVQNSQFLNPADTGTMQLYANGVPLGSPVAINRLYASIYEAETMTMPGTYAITAVYSGDGYYQSSTSSAFSQIVTVKPAVYQLTVAIPTVTVAAGATTANSNTLTISSSNGFVGAVNLACVVTSNSAVATSSMPTCSFSSNSLKVMVDTLPPSALVTIGTTHSSAIQAGSRRPGLGEHTGFEGVALGAVLACLIPRRRRGGTALLLCVLLCSGLTALSGCSSGDKSTPTPLPISGTTAGTYTVTITPSSTAALTTAGSPVSFALTVQ